MEKKRVKTNREKEKEEEWTNSSFKNPTYVAGDGHDFGEVKMVKVLAGRRKVKDVFDVVSKFRFYFIRVIK